MLLLLLLLLHLLSLLLFSVVVAVVIDHVYCICMSIAGVVHLCSSASPRSRRVFRIQNEIPARRRIHIIKTFIFISVNRASVYNIYCSCAGIHCMPVTMSTSFIAYRVDEQSHGMYKQTSKISLLRRRLSVFFSL
jgi:hypothetical protein